MKTTAILITLVLSMVLSTEVNAQIPHLYGYGSVATDAGHGTPQYDFERIILGATRTVDGFEVTMEFDVADEELKLGYLRKSFFSNGMFGMSVVAGVILSPVKYAYAAPITLRFPTWPDAQGGTFTTQSVGVGMELAMGETWMFRGSHFGGRSIAGSVTATFVSGEQHYTFHAYSESAAGIGGVVEASIARFLNPTVGLSEFDNGNGTAFAQNTFRIWGPVSSYTQYDYNDRVTDRWLVGGTVDVTLDPLYASFVRAFYNTRDEVVELSFAFAMGF